MTFNSAQQERLLAALERIADALERSHPEPVPDAAVLDAFHERQINRDIQPGPDIPTTKGPYR